MVVLLIVVAWILFGWLACRRLAKDWFEEFGDYRDMPWPLLPLFFLFGPYGFILTFFVAPPKALKGRDFHLASRLFFLPKAGK